MTTFIAPVRDYKFSDARLIEIVLEKIAFAQRDAAELATVGIDTTAVDNLNLQALAFGAMPTDTIELGEQEEATEEKDIDADLLMDKLKELRSAARRALGEKSKDYGQFGFKDLDKFRIADLLALALVIPALTTKHAVVLATKGWEAADNTELQTMLTALVGGLQNQKLEIGSRDSAAEARITAGNDLYNVVGNELCEAGKEYWRTRSEAKYNDYIIHNTPSGTDLESYNIQTYNIPGGGSMLVPLGPGPLSPTLQLYFRCTTGSVLICTTDLPASSCIDGYEALEDVTFKDVITALGLDLSKTHMQVTNPGLTTAIVRVGVKEEEE